MKNNFLASLGRPLWRSLGANNIDADALFRKFGLDPSLIHEPRTRYPYEVLCKIWAEAAVITDDEHLALQTAKYLRPLDLNALGVTFLSSADLTEALQRLERYVSLLNTNLEFSCAENDGRLDVCSPVSSIAEDAILIAEDSRKSLVVALSRLGLYETLDPVEVAFTYPEPKSTGEHFGLFRCPVLFSQPVSRVSFSLADARRPFTDANRELAISNDRFLDEMVSGLKSADIVSQVKHAILHDLPSGTPSEEDIAKDVFVSSRTLQRRLADENTNFRQLIAEVRRELAQKYITDQDMPLAEISYMLGFSDISAFSRAFKRWTGEAPTVFRSNLQK